MMKGGELLMWWMIICSTEGGGGGRVGEGRGIEGRGHQCDPQPQSLTHHQNVPDDPFLSSQVGY